MKKNLLTGLIILCAMLMVTGTANAYEIMIDVSPNVLNLQSSGTVVTVHTNVDYNAVVASSVFLNGIPIATWKSDDRGYFVAKFVMQDVKNLPLVVDGLNTLTLLGYTDDGQSFIGSQEIKVINVIPRGR
jgi:hypothetical protein